MSVVGGISVRNTESAMKSGGNGFVNQFYEARGLEYSGILLTVVMHIRNLGNKHLRSHASRSTENLYHRTRCRNLQDIFSRKCGETVNFISM